MVLIVFVVQRISAHDEASSARRSELEVELRQTRQELSTAKRARGLLPDQSRVLEEREHAVDQIRRALDEAAVTATRSVSYTHLTLPTKA